RIVRKVLLPDLTVDHRDGEIQGRGNAVDGAAHHLRFQTERIDHAPDIDHADRAMDAQPVALNGYLESVRGIAAEGEVTGDTHTTTVAAFFLPVNLFGTQLQDVGHAPGVEYGPAMAAVGNFARFAEHFQAQVDGVAPDLESDLVDEALDREGMEGVDRSPPPAARHAGRDGMKDLLHIVDQAGGKIVRLQTAREDRVVLHSGVAVV